MTWCFVERTTGFEPATLTLAIRQAGHGGPGWRQHSPAGLDDHRSTSRESPGQLTASCGQTVPRYAGLASLIGMGGSFRRRFEITGQQWRAKYRYRPGGCPVVKPEDFVNEALAKKQLGLRTRAGVRLLVFRTVLDPCVVGDLATRESIGVTRTSVEREVQRRRTATLAERMRWRINGFFHYL